MESDPERAVEGVFAMWYGKGPGVDRAGDALKHGNAYGSSPHGGVVVVAGDDHGCVSSSMPHQSDHAFRLAHAGDRAGAASPSTWSSASTASRCRAMSGDWVGFTALSEVVESAATVDLDAVHASAPPGSSGDAVAGAAGYRRRADGLHYRWPDLPSLAIERACRQARRGARLRPRQRRRPQGSRRRPDPCSAS